MQKSENAKRDLQTEKAHLFAFQRLLKVSLKTPNDTAYGERGSTAMHLDAKVSSIRFWFRLMRMENESLPRKAYNMLVIIHNSRERLLIRSPDSFVIDRLQVRIPAERRDFFFPALTLLC